jgi:hypothetical protein
MALQQGDLDNYEAAWRDEGVAEDAAAEKGKSASGAETFAVPDAQVEASTVMPGDIEAAKDEYAEGFGIDTAKVKAPSASKTPEPSRFSEAFANARAAKADKFTWRGKAYSTKLASDKPARGSKAEIANLNKHALSAARDIDRAEGELAHLPPGAQRSKVAVDNAVQRRDEAKADYEQLAAYRSTRL